MTEATSTSTNTGGGNEGRGNKGRGRGGRGRSGGRGRGRGGRGGNSKPKNNSDDSKDSPTVTSLQDPMSNLSIDDKSNAQEVQAGRGDQGRGGRGGRNSSNGGRGRGRMQGRGGRGRGGRGDGKSTPTPSKKETSTGNDIQPNDGTDDYPDQKQPHQQNEKKGKGGKQKDSEQNNKVIQTNKAPASAAKKQNEGKQPKTSGPKESNKSKSNDQRTKTNFKLSTPPNQSQQTSDINYGKGENITILHVGEKPSIAEAIAKGLCNGDRSVMKKAMPVHTFTNPAFPKAPFAKKVTHKVTSVAGHVFSVDFPQEFQSWDSVDPAELFHAPIKRKPCQGSVVNHLANEAKGVDFIVLWMDCDREGENINFEVLDVCMHLMKGGGGVAHYDRVYRAYFSAINPSDIMKAYNALGKPDKNQALSVDARQELDLKVGVAFSRFQTKFFQGRYGDLDSSVLSYGPCQSPTLGFVVQRHIDIETFKPEPYWFLELGILKRGRQLRALWESGRSFQKQKTEAIVEKAMEDGATATVTNVVMKDKKQGRPVPLNTVSLLKACSKALGIGPHHAMQVAERLYLSGYLSYPRTESTAYPKSFDIKGTLEQQAGDGRWGAFVRELLAQGPNKSRGGVDMGDHPPITPMRAAGSHELSGDMGRVYDMVVRHFIASVSPDAVWRSTKVSFEVDALGEKGKFSLAGKELVSPGFLAILLHKEYGDEVDKDDEEDEEERSIPEFIKGEKIPIVRSNTSGSSSSTSKVNVAPSQATWGSLDVKEKVTSPPGYLTESELIGLMEKHGIGTDASISTHIENIQKRNYVRLETGRRLIPNKLGLVLVQGYHQIDSSLVLPKVRADIEGQCNKIAKGEMEKDLVIKRAIDIFEEKYQFFVKHIDRMDILFSSSFSKLEDVGKPFTRCGLSRRYLQLIPGPPPRLYNKFTETVYPLPAGGNIKQWSGRNCPVEGCNFELCLYSVGAPPRTFPLCPNCFNSADWALDDTGTNDEEDKQDENKERQIRRMAGKNLVLECPLPDDHPLIDELYVSPDPDSDGVFILDPHFGPKWRLVSTRDATIIHLPKSIDKITVLDETDEVTGCHKIKVQFKEGESPLEGGESKYACFFPTDKILQDASRVYHGSERTASSGRGGGRGRGRGRGRGSRGRGGGRGRGRR
ncbi:DNA topoisomerase [Nitzschia inconspicua]|uniref:DNA topoisomerase n=1 Tax=Nitzschia inconspicua TaxID=303405 RepID=A0A9K3LI40_9STRA|nr:DNA topoisomerase [Nitzschia inconspicua]